MPEHRNDEHAVDASCTQVQKGLGGEFGIRIGFSVGDTDDTSTIDRTIERSLSYRRARKQPSPLLELVRGEVVVGDRMNQLTVESVNSAVGRSAKTHRILHDGLEDWLGVRVGRADRSENLRGGSLPAERFGQFSITRLQLLEEAHILDGNDRLVGEGLEHLNLLGRKGPNDVPRQADDPDRLLPVQQRDRELASGSSLPCGGSGELGGRLKVGNVNDLSIQEGPAGRIVSSGTARERLLIPLNAFRA